MKRTIYFIVIPFTILAFSYWFFFILGFWPAALVGGKPIFLRDFEENVRASKQFYNANKIQGKIPDLNFEENSKKTIGVIEKQILNVMIEDRILSFEYDKAGGNNLLKRVEEKISSVVENESKTNLTSGISLLYGWNFEEFKKRILKPQALREVLIDDAKKENRNFEDFLRNEKQKANVKVFLLDLRWDKDRLEVVERNI